MECRSLAEVLVIVAGPVGSGKSAVLGVIEATLMLRGLSVRYDDDKAAQVERALGGDWAEELARTMPLIVLVEQIDRPLSPRAEEIINAVPAGHGFTARMKVAIDNALSLSWWRGYTAGLMGRDER